jgi:molybdenum cofactor cytidylyltransferase
MIAAEEVVLVLLAAGRSQRFGAADKLEADLNGTPLGLHVVAALADVPFRARIVVRSGCGLDFAAHGYTDIANPRPELGMSGSVQLGVERARAMGAAAALIALADMPCVTAAHVRRLLDAGGADDAVVASSDGMKPMPPALFGHGRLDALLGLTGDAGARDLLRGGRHVAADSAELVDIDTLEELRALRDRVSRR